MRHPGRGGKGSRRLAPRGGQGAHGYTNCFGRVIPHSKANTHHLAYRGIDGDIRPSKTNNNALPKQTYETLTYYIIGAGCNSDHFCMQHAPWGRPRRKERWARSRKRCRFTVKSRCPPLWGLKKTSWASHGALNSEARQAASSTCLTQALCRFVGGILTIHPLYNPNRYMKFDHLFATRLSVGPTILRIGLATTMFPHGAQKALGNR